MTTILFLVLGIWLGATISAYATTTVRVVATDPPGDVVTLGSNQNFYLHLQYQTDHPVQIWARPYYQGKTVNAGSNPSRVYPSGSGEALGWFFFFKPGTQVDEVRITAGNGSIAGTPVVATYPVQVTGGDQPAPAQDKPEWVVRLGALDAAAQKEDYEKRMNAPVSARDTILFGGFMLGMLALGVLGFALPAWGLWRWRGGWRVAAAVPAALMAFVVLRLLVGVSADPTSHNLWPFEILMTGALSVVIMIAAGVARKITGADRT
ncbi:MAG: hypothetical protein ACREVQ_05255 [Burkholderiales bacterium]